MNASHALALRERAARQRDDDEHREQVAARLVTFASNPPKTRRDAAQFQRDLDTWTAWVSAGTAPDNLHTVRKIAAEKPSLEDKSAPKVKRSKPGPGIERDRQWAEKGEAPRRVACVVYEIVPITGELWRDGDTYHMAAPEPEEES